MREIKTILLCCNRFAFPALQQLYFFNQLKVVVVPSHCGEVIEQAERLLQNTGVTVLSVTRENYVSHLEEAIRQNQINLGLILTFSYKIPASVYSLTELGFYNVHPGLLPEYRGADPVFQQIRNQEKFVGVTIHQVDDGIDTGAIVMKERIPLSLTDTNGIVTTRLSHLAAAQTGILVKMMQMNLTIHAKKQDETAARYFDKQTASDVCINWQDMDAGEIIALINACNPWNKGAVTRINHQFIRLLEAKKISGKLSSNQLPGDVVAIGESGIVVSAINNEVLLIPIIYAEEGFLPGCRVKEIGIVAGSRFESC